MPTTTTPTPPPSNKKSSHQSSQLTPTSTPTRSTQHGTSKTRHSTSGSSTNVKKKVVPVKRSTTTVNSRGGANIRPSLHPSTGSGGGGGGASGGGTPKNTKSRTGSHSTRSPSFAKRTPLQEPSKPPPREPTTKEPKSLSRIFAGRRLSLEIFNPSPPLPPNHVVGQVTSPHAQPPMGSKETMNVKGGGNDLKNRQSMGSVHGLEPQGQQGMPIRTAASQILSTSYPEDGSNHSAISVEAWPPVADIPHSHSVQFNAPTTPPPQPPPTTGPKTPKKGKNVINKVRSMILRKGDRSSYPSGLQDMTDQDMYSANSSTGAMEYDNVEDYHGDAEEVERRFANQVGHVPRTSRHSLDSVHLSHLPTSSSTSRFEQGSLRRRSFDLPRQSDKRWDSGLSIRGPASRRVSGSKDELLAGSYGGFSSSNSTLNSTMACSAIHLTSMNTSNTALPTAQSTMSITQQPEKEGKFKRVMKNWFKHPKDMPATSPSMPANRVLPSTASMPALAAASSATSSLNSMNGIPVPMVPPNQGMVPATMGKRLSNSSSTAVMPMGMTSAWSIAEESEESILAASAQDDSTMSIAANSNEGQISASVSSQGSRGLLRPSVFGVFPDGAPQTTTTTTTTHPTTNGIQYASPPTSSSSFPKKSISPSLSGGSSAISLSSTPSISPTSGQPGMESMPKRGSWGSRSLGCLVMDRPGLAPIVEEREKHANSLPPHHNPTPQSTPPNGIPAVYSMPIPANGKTLGAGVAKVAPLGTVGIGGAVVYTHKGVPPVPALPTKVQSDPTSVMVQKKRYSYDETRSFETASNISVQSVVNAPSKNIMGMGQIQALKVSDVPVAIPHQDTEKRRTSHNSDSSSNPSLMSLTGGHHQKAKELLSQMHILPRQNQGDNHVSRTSGSSASNLGSTGLASNVSVSNVTAIAEGKVKKVKNLFERSGSAILDRSNSSGKTIKRDVGKDKEKHRKKSSSSKGEEIGRAVAGAGGNVKALVSKGLGTGAGGNDKGGMVKSKSVGPSDSGLGLARSDSIPASVPSVPSAQPQTIAQKYLSKYTLHPRFLQRYALLDELGSGGFGFVLTARALTTHAPREVAVKFIFSNKVPRHSWIKDSDFGALVPMEIKIMKSVAHENIVGFLEAYRDEVFWVLVMELHGESWCAGGGAGSQNQGPGNTPKPLPPSSTAGRIAEIKESVGRPPLPAGVSPADKTQKSSNPAPKKPVASKSVPLPPPRKANSTRSASDHSKGSKTPVLSAKEPLPERNLSSSATLVHDTDDHDHEVEAVVARATLSRDKGDAKPGRSVESPGTATTSSKGLATSASRSSLNASASPRAGAAPKKMATTKPKASTVSKATGKTATTARATPRGTATPKLVKKPAASGGSVRAKQIANVTARIDSGKRPGNDENRAPDSTGNSATAKAKTAPATKKTTQAPNTGAKKTASPAMAAGSLRMKPASLANVKSKVNSGNVQLVNGTRSGGTPAKTVANVKKGVNPTAKRAVRSPSPSLQREGGSRSSSPALAAARQSPKSHLSPGAHPSPPPLSLKNQVGDGSRSNSTSDAVTPPPNMSASSKALATAAAKKKNATPKLKKKGSSTTALRSDADGLKEQLKGELSKSKKEEPVRKEEPDHEDDAGSVYSPASESLSILTVEEVQGRKSSEMRRMSAAGVLEERPVPQVKDEPQTPLTDVTSVSVPTSSSTGKPRANANGDIYSNRPASSGKSASANPTIPAPNRPAPPAPPGKSQSQPSTPKLTPSASSGSLALPPPIPPPSSHASQEHMPYSSNGPYVPGALTGTIGKRNSMDLFECIEQHSKLSESISRKVFRQIASAVHYLHTKNILHRDLKDENICVDGQFNVKLIDFGSSAYIPREGEYFKRFAGTAQYASPQILKGEQYKGPEQEIWSLGILLYTMLSGGSPFQDPGQVFAHEKSGGTGLKKPVTIRDDGKKGRVSEECWDLITGMLQPSVAKRMTIEEVVIHPWLNLR